MSAKFDELLHQPRLTAPKARGTMTALSPQDTQGNEIHEHKPANQIKPGGGRLPMGWQMEAAGIAGLLAMAGYFLAISWRKWPDPIVDSGPQLYAIWRVSGGARLYHDFLWNYGPLSVCFNAALFKIFGPGLMVLATANLVFYAAILVMTYVAFRKAWGWLGAFAALAVFISVFSFSHLLAIGNYNFVTPYAAEASHGTALILATALLVSGYREFSRKNAFLLGLCGGLAAVMKPEFMLATGLLGIVALVLRWQEKRPMRMEEFGWMGLGVILPTLAFTAWFVRVEPIKQAFIDASQAWWLVLVTRIHNGDVQQKTFMGLNSPWKNAEVELLYSLCAIFMLAAIWSVGWVANNHRFRRFIFIVWSGISLLIAEFVLFGAKLFPDAHAAVVFWLRHIYKYEAWYDVGRCLPGLTAAIFIFVAVRMWNEVRNGGAARNSTLMSLLLALLGGAMLVRMPLFARVFHLGFFQADFAAMVVAAMMVSELPRWVGEGIWGRTLTVGACLCALALCCGTIAAKSGAIRADQTEVVGQGRDRFYSTTRMIDGTGALVNWAAVKVSSMPADTRVMVLPEGVMINYLSRHKAPEPGWQRGQEQEFVDRLEKSPPECVVLISREMKEFGVTRFGARGNPGSIIIPWVGSNYVSVAQVGGDPLDPNAQVGAVIMRLNRSSTNAPAK